MYIQRFSVVAGDSHVESLRNSQYNGWVILNRAIFVVPPLLSIVGREKQPGGGVSRFRSIDRRANFGATRSMFM